jgi:hypothetical protein
MYLFPRAPCVGSPNVDHGLRTRVNELATRCLRALSPLRVEVCEEAAKSVDLARGVGDSGHEHCLVLSLRFVAFRREAKRCKERGPIVPLEWIARLLVYFRRVSLQADGLIKAL